MENVCRKVEAELHYPGKSPQDIIMATGYASSTVYDTTKKLKASGDVSCKAAKSRLEKIQKPTFLAGLKQSIKANAFTPLMNLTKKKEREPEDHRQSSQQGP